MRYICSTGTSRPLPSDFSGYPVSLLSRAAGWSRGGAAAGVCVYRGGGGSPCDLAGILSF